MHIVMEYQNTIFSFHCLTGAESTQVLLCQIFSD